MKAFLKNCLYHLSSKKYVLYLGLAFFWLILALIINFYAGVYATESASNSVNDIVLSNIPVFNVDVVFVYGPWLIWLFVTVLCFSRPQKAPFVIKSIALFVIIRSIFITLTHIGPFPDHTLVDYSSDWVKKFTFGGDLFFSAHTGLPFLMALVFAKDKYLFTLFSLTAIFFGVIVLMGHLHYSIDVLSAFFITYTIYHICLYLFKKDKRLFDTDISHI